MVAAPPSPRWRAVSGCSPSVTPSTRRARGYSLSPIPPYDEDLVGTGLLTGTGDPTRDAPDGRGNLETERASAVTAQAPGPEPRGRGLVGERRAARREQRPGRHGDRRGTRLRPAPRERVRAHRAGDPGRAGPRLLRGAIDQAVERRRSVGEDDAGSADLAQRINRLEAAYGRGGDPTLRLLEPATAPGSQAGLGPGLIVAVVFLGGLGFGALLALVVDSLSPRVRTPTSWRASPGCRSSPACLASGGGSSGAHSRSSACVRRSATRSTPPRAARGETGWRWHGPGRERDREGRANGRGRRAGPRARGGRSRGDRGRRSRNATAARRSRGGRGPRPCGCGRRSADLISEASEPADFVVIDTAPFSENSDALALTHVVDATILVARGATPG